MTATATAEPAAEQRRYLEQFRLFEQALSRNGSDWPHSLRKAALERFAALGFPLARKGNEEWKYTSVAVLARQPFEYAAGPSHAAVRPSALRRLLPQDRGWVRLVFVDGRFAPSLSTPAPHAGGIVVTNLAHAVAKRRDLVEPHLARHASVDNDAFTALNTAFLHDGAFIAVGRDHVLDTPVHLVFVTVENGARPVSHPRVLLVAGEGSRATVVESYVGLSAGPCFTNAVTEIALGQGAAVEHYRFTLEGPEAYHVATTHVRQDRDSSFASWAVTTGSALVRNTLRILLAAPGASCQPHGLYLVTGTQHLDNNTVIDHAEPHTTSRQYYKGILDGRGRAVFTGKVVVRPNAQKADAYQANRNLVLSEGAEIDTKPSLEIFADDVKCTHGATAGQLDPDTLFYLTSRGLDAESARRILVRAFAGEIIDTVRQRPVRAYLDRLLSRALPALKNGETS